MPSFHGSGIAAFSASSTRLVSASTSSAVGTPSRCSAATPTSRPSRSSPSAAVSVRAASRLASWSRRSAKAATAPVRKATASWISKSSVTLVSLTPRSYSTGTSARKRRSCWARRAASSGVNGAAVKPSSASAARAVSLAAKAARACSVAAAPRSSS